MDSDDTFSRFKANQRDLLLAIRKVYEQNKTEIFPPCRKFLSNQREQLRLLEEKRNLHLNERGKLEYRLVPTEKVPLTFLEKIFSDFARPLDEFIQIITKILGLRHSLPVADLNNLKKEAIQLARNMLNGCLVLDKQPLCTNYEKKENKIPNILFLGAHCFSNVEIFDCQLTVVSESSLLFASRDDNPLQTVEGLKGFTVKSSKEAKPSTTRANQRGDSTISKSLGIWFIPKDKLASMEKGNAHKDFLRLKYTVKVKFENTTENLMLLSIPFNIRKSSCQMYTFTGALMWYFYNTSDPYGDFTVSDRLPITTVLNMLVTRMEVIGRELSPTARTFFKDRLENISNNGKVDLDRLAKGPPTNRDNQTQASNESRSVDEAIDLYGFFTWFYALAKSLDTSGYLHQFWINGYICDICDVEHVQNLIKQPLFGAQTVVIRPSMSTIYKYQGEEINMDLAFFFKVLKQPENVLSPKLTMQDLKECDLHTILTSMLHIEFIKMKDGKVRSVDDLKKPQLKKPQLAEKMEKSYHTTTFQIARGIVLTGADAQTKHCSTCRCHCMDMDEDTDPDSSAKKSRNLSGNSDVITSTSDLPHKRRGDSLTGSQASPEPSTTTNGHSQVSSPRGMTSQVSSPRVMTSPYQHRGSQEYSTVSGSPDSGTSDHMSPYENRIPDFDSILTPSREPCKEMMQGAPVNKREQLLANCMDAFNSLSQRNFLGVSDDTIDKLSQYFQNCMGMPESPEQTTPPVVENKNHIVLVASCPDQMAYGQVVIKPDPDPGNSQLLDQQDTAISTIIAQYNEFAAGADSLALGQSEGGWQVEEGFIPVGVQDSGILWDDVIDLIGANLVNQGT